MTAKKQSTAMKTETVCYGDCLEHLKQWIRWNNNIFEGQPSLADLIYLDPPWNSGANYNILFGSAQASDSDAQTAQEIAFTDMWQWNVKAKQRVDLITGADDKDDEYHNHPAFKSILALKTLLGKSGMLAYCSYMAERLALLHAMLKDTGSIYLHCDPHASHYLKMIMDNIFGAKCYRNEIVWCYTGPSNTKNWFPRKHDIILCYGKTKQDPKTQADPALKTKFNPDAVRVPYDEITMKRRSYSEGTASIISPSAKNKGKRGREEAEAEFGSGKIPEDYWTDIPAGGQIPKKERTGYPTQKPLKLLKRIIQASTDEGDVVLDPFCGCGTAVVAARQLKRRFVGIDISLYAMETVAWGRLVNEAKMREEDIRVIGIPADFPSAKRFAKDDPFAFERFAVEACIPGMVANKVQRVDKGIDGKGWLLHPVIENGKKKSKILAQVKAGKPTLSQVRDFATVIRDTEGAVAGVFITVDKIGKEGDGTEEMRRVAYRQGTFRHEHSMEEFPRLQFWHIERFFFKSARQRLPHLPELSDPHKKEKVPIRQTGFLAKQYWGG